MLKGKPRTPSFLADLKGESAVQRRLQNAINESNGDEDDDDTPSMVDLANSLVNYVNGYDIFLFFVLGLVSYCFSITNYTYPRYFFIIDVLVRIFFISFIIMTYSPFVLIVKHINTFFSLYARLFKFPSLKPDAC